MRYLYENYFTTAVGGAPLEQYLGNGQIVQSGAALQIVCPSGIDCTWSGGDYDAPHAYVKDGVGFLAGAEYIVDSGNAGAGILCGECKINAISTGDSDSPKCGIALYQSTSNNWQLFYDYSTRKISLYKIISGTATTVATTTVAVNSPNTTPLHFKFFLNTHPSRTIVNDFNNAMSPGQIAAYYSDTDGSVWAQVGSNQSVEISSDGSGFGVFLKRSSASVTTRAWARFDHFRIFINEPEALFYASGGRQTETAAWEDTLSYETDTQVNLARANDSDPSNHQGMSAWEDDLFYGFDRIVYLERSPDDSTYDGATWGDDVSYEIDTQVDPGKFPVSTANYQSRADFEDNLTVAMDPSATWMDGTLDSAGKEILNSYSIRDMIYYDLTNEPWRYGDDLRYSGATASGEHWKINGINTSVYQGICTVASGIPVASWATHVDPLGYLWNNTGATSYFYPPEVISDGVLRLRTRNPLTGWQAVGIGSHARWCLYGNFDIQISYSNYSSSGGTDGGLEFNIGRDYGHRIYMARLQTAGTHAYGTDMSNEGTWGGRTTYNTTQTSGRMRFVRTGSSVQAYRDSGGGWATIGPAQNFGTWDVYVWCHIAGTGSWTGDVRIYSFQVNSGTFNYTVGWHKEGWVAGSHRGAVANFPERSYIVAGAEALNIIDASTNKLWMRFNNVYNNVYHRSPNEARMGIVSLAMHDGVLYWANACPEQQTGHVGRMDFTIDDFRHISSSSSYPFSPHYTTGGSNKGGNVPGYMISAGHTWHRNTANGYPTSSVSAWSLPANPTFGVAVTHEDIEWEIAAFATAGGLGIKKFPRWKWTNSGTGLNIYSTYTTKSSNTARAFWCDFDHDTREVFWMTRTQLCSAAQATYQAAWSSTFAANTTKTLPGHRGRLEQFRCLRKDGYIYVVATEGVYRILWPTGSWELVIGKPGSGALSEVLSLECNYPVTVRAMQDNGIDLLMVAVENERMGWTQVCFIKLSDLSLYAKSRILTGRAGSPKALLG